MYKGQKNVRMKEERGMKSLWRRGRIDFVEVERMEKEGMEWCKRGGGRSME